MKKKDVLGQLLAVLYGARQAVIALAFIPFFFIVLGFVLAYGIVAFSISLSLVTQIVQRFYGENFFEQGVFAILYSAFVLVPMILIFVFSTILPLVFSIFFILRNKEKISERAIALNLRREAEFSLFIESICKLNEIKERKPNAVLLNFYPRAFVSLFPRRLPDRELKGKILSIGIVLLNYLSIQEMRAILVHELAHFSGKEAAYIAFIDSFVKALSINNELVSSGARLIHKIDLYTSRARGLAGILFILLVPVLLPLRYAILVSSKALEIPSFVVFKYMNLWEKSKFNLLRERELRADRIAVYTCGSCNFINALRKVVACKVAFDYFLENYLSYTLAKVGESGVNLYRDFHDLDLLNRDDVLKLIEKEMSEFSADKNDTHPSIGDRIRRASLMKSESCFPENPKAASSLFAGMEEYEEEITNQVIDRFFDVNHDDKYPDGSPWYKFKKISKNCPDPPLFQRRFWANFIDFTLIFLAFIVIRTTLVFLAPVVSMLGIGDVWDFLLLGYVGTFPSVFLCLTLIYFSVFESSAWKGTLGKLFFDIRVIRGESDEPIDLTIATARIMLKVIPILIPRIGFYMLMAFLIISLPVMIVVFIHKEREHLLSRLFAFLNKFMLHDILTSSYVRKASSI